MWGTDNENKQWLKPQFVSSLCSKACLVLLALEYELQHTLNHSNETQKLSSDIDLKIAECWWVHRKMQHCILQKHDKSFKVLDP